VEGLPGAWIRVGATWGTSRVLANVELLGDGMLRRFLYLNEATVNSYIGVVEGGLSDESTRRRGERGVKGGEGGISASFVSAKATGQRELSEDDERIVRDTPEHRFDRLMRALDADPERWDYEDVMDLAEAFDRLATGTLITVECEIEVPPAIALLSQPDEINSMIDMVESFATIAPVFGGNMDGLPDAGQLRAARAFTRFKVDLVVVGVVDEDTPKIAGKLDRAYVREMPEGEARVIGKVARRWKEGDQHSLMALPGAALMNRAQRRKAQSHDEDDEYVLHGPALTLDILAIYR
jgi:hypothetical protein